MPEKETMRLLKSKKENRKLFDGTDNERQLEKKTYCLADDNEQKRTICLPSDVYRAHALKMSHASSSVTFFTYCQRPSLQLHLEERKRNRVSRSREAIVLINRSLADSCSRLLHLKSSLRQTVEVTRQQWP